MCSAGDSSPSILRSYHEALFVRNPLCARNECMMIRRTKIEINSRALSLIIRDIVRSILFTLHCVVFAVLFHCSSSSTLANLATLPSLPRSELLALDEHLAVSPIPKSLPSSNPSHPDSKSVFYYTRHPFPKP